MLSGCVPSGEFGPGSIAVHASNTVSFGDFESGEALVAPGGTPGVLDEPVAFAIRGGVDSDRDWGLLDSSHQSRDTLLFSDPAGDLAFWNYNARVDLLASTLLINGLVGIVFVSHSAMISLEASTQGHYSSHDFCSPFQTC